MQWRFAFRPPLCAAIILLALVFPPAASVCAQGASSDSGGSPSALDSAAAATVDDLFRFYLDHRDKSLGFGDFHAAGASRIQSKLDADLAANLERFGHMPEYWELRAQTSFAKERGARTMFNRRCLERAVELDPSRSAAIIELAAMDRESMEKAFEEEHTGGVSDTPPPPEMYSAIADGYARAARGDPDNGYLPFFEAVERVGLGELDRAWELFEKCADSPRFYKPELFPMDYVKWRNDALATGEPPFEGLSMGERYYLLSTYGTALPNFIRAKDACRTAAMATRLGCDYTRPFTSIHRAACRMAKNDEPRGMIYSLVAIVMIGICAREANDIAIANGDEVLRDAAAAVVSECNAIKTLIRGWSEGGRGSYDALAPFAIWTLENIESLPEGDFKDALELSMKTSQGQSNNDATKLEVASTALGYLAYMSANSADSEKNLVDGPLAKEIDLISTLDYANPGEWYAKWLDERGLAGEE
ncbi:MAG: hypothetical protein HRF49_01240 [bacterium]|jgi:hypothetical protein